MAWTVLLVDDSRTIREVVRMTYFKTDFNLVAASNGEEGLRLAREVRPHLVLADVRMPGMDGYELCRSLKADPQLRNVPVLLFAGRNVEVDRAKSKEAGAQGVFLKPFDTQDLLDQSSMLCEAAEKAAPPAGAEAARPAAAKPDDDLTEIESIVVEEPREGEEWTPPSAEGLIRTDEVVRQAREQAPSDGFGPAFDFPLSERRQSEAQAKVEQTWFTEPSAPKEISEEEAASLLEEIEEEADSAAGGASLEAGERQALERARHTPLSDLDGGETGRAGRTADPFGLDVEPLSAAPSKPREAVADPFGLDDFAVEVEEVPAGSAHAEELDRVVLEEKEPVAEDAAAEFAEVIADELAQEEVTVPAETVVPPPAGAFRPEEPKPVPPEAAPAGVRPPSGDEILLIFRRAIREEVAALSAPAAVLTPEMERAVREAVRQEVKVALALAQGSAPDRGERPVPMDQQELLTAIRQAVRSEVEESVGQVLRESLRGLRSGGPEAPTLSSSGLTREDLTDVVGRVVGRDLALAIEQIPRPEPPVPPPSAEAVAKAVAEHLEAPLAAIREAARPTPPDLKGLAEVIHTWIQSALAEFPSADEIRQIVGQTPPPAAGSSVSLPGDPESLRALIREELGRLWGASAEAVAWEVVPDLAEAIVKKELDRLTSDGV